jgi:hypothetical protein
MFINVSVADDAFTSCGVLRTCGTAWEGDCLIILNILYFYFYYDMY